MAVTIATAGEQLVHIPTGNVKAMIPVAGYTTPLVGDLVIYDVTENNAVDRCAADEMPIGEVLSTNNDNGILSVAEYKSSTRVILPYTGTLAVGEKIEAAGSRAAGGTKDQVRVNASGVGTVVAIDVPAAGFAVVEF